MMVAACKGSFDCGGASLREAPPSLWMTRELGVP
jgi:hypothetical protein